MRTRLVVFAVLLCAWPAAAEAHPPTAHAPWALAPQQPRQPLMPPWATGQPFAEPPSIKSVNKRLKFTMLAKNGTITVGGLAIDSAQRYTPAGSRAGLLGPTLRVNPGD